MYIYVHLSIFLCYLCLDSVNSSVGTGCDDTQSQLSGAGVQGKLAKSAVSSPEKAGRVHKAPTKTRALNMPQSSNCHWPELHLIL